MLYRFSLALIFLLIHQKTLKDGAQMKISAKTKDCRLLVRVKTSFRETIDEKELDRFARVYLRCFLKPKLVKRNLVEYAGPVGIPLKERLKKEVTKRDFLFILEHIVVAVQKLRGNSFAINNLNMDMQQIYINETTKELQFLYVPLTSQQSAGSIIELFNSIIYLVRPAAERDTEYVSRFNYFFKSLKPFDIDKVEQFIQREDRSVVNTIKKHNAGQSGFMTSDHKHYHDYMDEQKKAQDDEATGLLEEAEDSTGLVSDEEATGLLSEFEEATGYLEDEEATGLLEDEATGLLADSDDEGTALLEERQVVPAVMYPELFRVLTGETITVNKPVFRIGKERSYVDYFVTNNNAVSRSHADIITRESGFFVIDLNSKNRTYINDKVLAVQEETVINDGDMLRLGNEEFVFRVTKNKSVIETPICPGCNARIKATSNFCPYCGQRIQS